MAPRQISITSSFSRFASRRSVANLSMAQKQIAPTTIMVKIEIRTKIIAIPLASILHCSKFRRSIPVARLLGHMLSMPPADSVIGSLPSRHDSAPGDAGWLSSGGPVLTPDSIDSVFDGCDAFSYEDRPATGVYCASGFSSKVIPRLDGTKKRDRRSLHPYGNPVHG